MAISLAKKGIDVILTWRSKEEEAIETVKTIEGLGQQAASLHLDMGDFKSLDNFVAAGIKHAAIEMENFHTRYI